MDDLEKRALEYHSLGGVPGKVSVVPTKRGTDEAMRDCGGPCACIHAGSREARAED